MDNNQTVNQTPPAQQAAQQPAAATPPPPPQHGGLSHDTKTLIVILLLVFAFPIGVILMWVWMKTWKTIIKVLITVIPLILTVIWYILFFSIFFTAMKNAEDTKTSETVSIETPTPSPFDQDGTPTPPLASASAVQSEIENSLNTEDYESLVPFMASLVQFEIEASEGVPAGDPQETVSNLAYLDTATAPWDFDQEAPIVQSIKTQYAQEYGDLYIGISSNDVLAAFGFDENGMINEIKVAVTYKLLVSE